VSAKIKAAIDKRVAGGMALNDVAGIVWVQPSRLSQIRGGNLASIPEIKKFISSGLIDFDPLSSDIDNQKLRSILKKREAMS
jgi:hypothetical protein